MAIAQIVSTLDVPAPDRLAFWVEAVCETFLELKIDSSAGPSFVGSVQTCPVGPLSLNFMSFEDQHLYRTREAISRGKINEFYLIQPRDRPVRFSQLGREVEVLPGGCTLIDSRYPFTIEHNVDRATLSVALPSNWLLTWLPAPEEVVAQAWQPGIGWGGVLATALANLTPESIDTLPVLPSVFTDQLGSLIALAASDKSNPPVRARINLLDRLRGTLKDAYPDVELDPVAVARHHGISLRYLHLQFAAAGTSFGADLLTIRLGNATRLLSDPNFRKLSIAEIAARCGFRNASHFARRFRDHAGISPTELRARHK